VKKLGDIDYKRGDTRPIRLRIKDPETGSYLDLTGSTFKMVVDPEQSPADGTNNIASIDGVIDPDQVTNIGRVSFTPTTTDTDHVGTFYYEVQMIDTAGHVITLHKKPYKFKLSQDIVK